MARWFANNVSLMILALLLAFFVWMLASLQQDPILENTIAAPVVITSQPLPDRTLSASTLPPTITVRLRAPQSVFETMGSNGVQVPVDLSQLGAGEHVVTLAPAISGSPSQLISARPTTATVIIEQVVTQALPIRVSLVGTPAIGYEAQTPTVTPQTATISGTQQVISQVASVDAIVTIDNMRASIEQAVRLVARNPEGGIVGNVSIAPEAVAVKVPMEQLSNYRALAVRAQLSGQPSEGYAITNISVNPQVVDVFGPNEAILQLPGFIETLEVSVQDATGDIEQQVGLNVPPNVSLVSDNQSVAVRVRIEPQTGARTVSRNPSVIGITAPLTATLSPPSVDIVLSGPLPQLNSLTENDVRVQVDASGLATGVQQLTPQVFTPDGITVQSVLPATVQIEVRDESAPTPTSP